MKRIVTLLLCVMALTTASAQKWENLAQTPPMGWNSWNKFACDINETLIREVAEAMVQTGLAEAGYTYINLDDCWHSAERDADGFAQCDPERFPSGMKALTDYIHSLGLKAGIYSDAGRETCGGRYGSFGHEYQDALQYARWGFDFLKYDWCMTENINPIGAYTLMRDALREAGRPILFSLCEWGSNKPWEWAQEVGHQWRTTGDIGLSFSEQIVHGTWEQNSVLRCIDLNEPLRKYAGPGHWNDPDMLEVGNGLSVNQDRAHFSMWCMMASPLLLGNDIRSMSPETLAIITNRELIAIDQDTLGVQGLRFLSDEGLEVWFKPLVNGDWAMCLFNRTKSDRAYTIDWQAFNLTDEEVSGRSTSFDTLRYEGRDLWNANEKPFTTKRAREVVVKAEDVIVYRLTPKTK